jgi:hypothetical protein
VAFMRWLLVCPRLRSGAWSFTSNRERTFVRLHFFWKSKVSIASTRNNSFPVPTESYLLGSCSAEAECMCWLPTIPDMAVRTTPTRQRNASCAIASPSSRRPQNKGPGDGERRDSQTKQLGTIRFALIPRVSLACRVNCPANRGYCHLPGMRRCASFFPTDSFCERSGAG